MVLNDLWIGDQVIILKSNRRGSFEGIHKTGRARVLVDGKILLITSSNLKLAPEIKVNKLAELNEELASSNSFYHKRLAFKPTIDLHIEKLQSEKQHENPIAILEFQLRKLREFMDKAISLRISKVEIIHGKGTGALKMETYNELENYPQKVSLFPINSDGGVVVYLKYNS